MASPLLVKPHPADAGHTVVEVTPRSAGWTYVGFKVCKLGPGETVKGADEHRETCLVILSGSAEVTVNGSSLGVLGGRASVFEDAPPGAAYVPAGSAFEVAARNLIELAVCTAPGKAGRGARAIHDAEMAREVRGKGSNTRYVRNILPQDKPADSLLVVEVITPSGNWSSYPPHKHDTATEGEETSLEETYYHRLNPPQGFAVQRVYTDDRSLDETISVGDGEVVMVPRGYHPVAAPHGYDLYYLNVMAGPARQWIFRNDPAHEWMVAPK